MIKACLGFALPVDPGLTDRERSMRHNPLKKVLYNYTSLQTVSSSLTFEVPRLKALQPAKPVTFASADQMAPASYLPEHQHL